MKNIIKKLISILAITMMLINSSLMLVISTAIDAVQSIIDESKINAIYELNLEKYVNYKVGDTPGLMVQANLKTGIEYQDGQEHVPIEATNVILKTPKVNEEYPEKVEVVVKSTKLTNGDENGKDFNCSYNKDKGEIKLITENKADENGNVYSENVTDARDEYQVILYYSSNCYNDKNEKRELDFSGKLYIGLKKDDNKTIKTQDISQKFEVTENVSGLISTNVTTSDIYNGYIRSNVKNNTTYRTEYTENMNIQVSYKEIADEVKINTKNLFVNNKDKEIETEEIVYKSTKISKDEVLNELGENGTLQIFDKDGNCLTEINKDSEADENGYVIVNYENELTELTFKLSKPEKIGEINVQNVKQIKETMKDTDVTKVETKNQISCINNVKKTEKVIDESTGESKDVETVKQVEFYNFENSNLADVKDAKSDVELSVDNTSWTNNVQNDVTFTATLVTNGPEYELFSNPVIQIKLPQEVEKVILGDVALLYGDNLQIKSTNVKQVDGYKVIEIDIYGTQNSYLLNQVTYGTNIIIPATIIAQKDIKSTDTFVLFDCVNSDNTNTSGNINVKINSFFEKNNIEIEKNQDIEEQSVKSIKEIKASDISVAYDAQLGKQTLKSGDTVYEGQVIKYSVKITNNTANNIKDLKVIGKIPEGMSYANISKGDGDDFDSLYEYVTDDSVKEYVKTIEELNANNTIEIEYNVVVNKLSEGENLKEVSSVVKVQTSSDNVLNDWTCNHKIEKAELRLRLKSGNSGSNVETNEWQYYLEIDNLTDNEYNDLDITFYVPEKLKIKRAFLQIGDYNLDVGELDSNRKLNMKLEKIAAKEKLIVAVYTLGCDFDDNIYEYDLNMNAKVSGKNINTYWANENLQTMYTEGLDVVQTSDKEGQDIKYKEKIEYNAVIKNVGKSLSEKQTYAYIIDKLPDNVKPISMEYDKYTYDEQTDTFKKSKENLDISGMKKTGIDVGILIPMGEEINVKIIVEANLVYTRTEISNTIILKGNYINTKISNTIKNTILPYNYVDPTPVPDPNPDPDPTPDPDPMPDPNPTPENKDYSISGVVWNDENKNGARENSEKLLSDITVKLFDIDTNQIATKNNQKQVTTTDENGQYKFSEVMKGNYIVLFEYDSQNYVLTNYKMQGISEDSNSDVIMKDVSIDGIEKKVGVTDTIKVVDSDVGHIDMGLIKNLKFDLSLKKYIKSVRVIQNSKNKTKEYEYNESQLAKIEIPSKEISETTLEIEYKIKITNEGELSGYVNELSDYLPEGMNFNEVINQNWTKNTNGDLVTSELSGIEIKPGENKEVTLILTKKLDSNSLGVIVNAAEISKVANNDNVADIDSVVANKNVNEDDYSEARVIISIKTGIVMYSILIIGVLLVMILIILIKKKVIKVKNVFGVFATLIIVVTILHEDICFAKTDSEWDKIAKDYIDSHLSEYGISSDSITLNSNSSNFATHASTGWENTGKIHCSDNAGRYSMCGRGDHTYTRQSVDITITERGSESETTNTYSSGTSNPSIDRVGTSNIAGPYKINKTGSCTDSGISLTVYGSSGIISNYSITDKNGNDKNIGYGEDFYIKLSSDIKKIEKIEFSTTVTASYVRTMKFNVYETWKCTSVSGSHVGINSKKEHGCKDPEKAQPGERAFTDKSGNISTTGDDDKSLELPGAELKTGDLKIIKTDTDTGNELAGAEFEITGGPDNVDITIKTDASGVATKKDLLIGDYVIKEKTAPSGYKIDFQENVNIDGVTKTIKAGETTTVSFNNKQYGSLKVTKKDENTGDTSLGGVKLSGVQFKLYVLKSNTKYYLKNTTSTKYSYSDFDETKKESAMTFKTDDNAQFEVDNLPVYEGKNKITYYIEEYALPSELAEYYQVKTEPDTIQLVNGTTQSTDIKNKQIYLDVSGYVWEDKHDNNKQTLRNDLYDSNETLISDVTVRLKRKGDINNDGVINQKDIDLLTYHLSGRSILTGEEYDRADLNNDGVVDVKDGVAISKIANSKTDLSATLQTTKTDSQNGAYKFRKVKIDELANYYIEFEYNGLRYQNVTKKLDMDNGSKAIENANNRKKFNNSYSTISGGNSKDKSGTKGSTLDENGNTTNILTYTNGTYSSSLVPNTAYTAESTKNSVSPQNGSMGAVIKANTKDAGYSLDQWKDGVVEIKNVNLGIAERSQPDLTIASDLDNMNMTINNYEHTYNFGQRADYINAGIPDINVNSGYNSLLDGFNVFVKNNKGTYRDITYQRGIEDSYIAFTKENKDSDERLRIYLTYKIVIKNESTIPFVKVKGLRNYSDADLDFVDSYIENGTSTDAKVTWKNVGKTSDSKRNIWQSGEIDTFVEPGKLKTIYLKFELKTDAICKLADLKANGGEVRIVGNTTEITAYSSYDSNKNAYAGIDMDSAPGNISYGDISTYEDDTDSTPDLKIMRKDPKVVSGLVFEDEKEENKKNDRIGDGKYEKGNNIVSGVNVQMVNYGGDDIITLYTLDEKGNVIKTSANKTTGKGGKFEFVGIIPGEYVTKYTYGKKGDMQTKIKSIDVTTQNYKSTIITNDKFKQAVQNRSEYWYQDATLENYSSALDDWTKRTEINNHLKVNTYTVKNDYDNNKDDEKYHYMVAKTGKMTFPIEDKKNQTTNYDYVEPSRTYNIKFGIIERPRQSLEVNKEISYIKLTLQNGTVLVEGDPRTTAMNYVTYPEKGMLKIEMDNNLVQGSTLQVEYTISVKNKSEADYNTESYYKYGTYNNTDKSVSLIVNSIVDYMDDGLTTEYTASSSDWKLKNGANIKNSLSSKAYDVIKNRKNILLNEWNKEIRQNETQYLKVEASKIVSVSDDNLYENYIEILSSTSDVGRFYGEEINGSWKNYTPGNYDLTNDTHESDDNGYDHISRAKFTIVPPTGSDNHVIYYIIGISCLIVIAGGVVIIKKFIL